MKILKDTNINPELAIEVTNCSINKDLSIPFKENIFLVGRQVFDFFCVYWKLAIDQLKQDLNSNKIKEQKFECQFCVGECECGDFDKTSIQVKLNHNLEVSSLKRSLISEQIELLNIKVKS